MSDEELDVDQLYEDIHNVAVVISNAIEGAESRRALALAIQTACWHLPREAHGLLVAELAGVQWEAQRRTPG